MIWIDKKTAVLKDTSIINFFDNGSVEFFPSKEWKKENKSNKYILFLKSKKQAKKVFNELNKILYEIDI